MRKSFYIGYKGRKEAYIYIWFSKSCRLVYVGETNNSNGVIGRANEHVTLESGTLYNRVYDIGYNLEEIDDMVLLSYPLPREKKFLSRETECRVSVEYLVQKKLRLLCIRSDKPYRVISKVTTGPYIGYERFSSIADEIALDFLEIYNEC